MFKTSNSTDFAVCYLRYLQSEGERNQVQVDCRNVQEPAPRVSTGQSPERIKKKI